MEIKSFHQSSILIHKQEPSTYQELKNILGKSSKCAPSRLQAGRTTKCDINNAQQKVSSVCLHKS